MRLVLAGRRANRRHPTPCQCAAAILATLKRTIRSGRAARVATFALELSAELFENRFESRIAREDRVLLWIGFVVVEPLVAAVGVERFSFVVGFATIL